MTSFPVRHSLLKQDETSSLPRVLQLIGRVLITTCIKGRSVMNRDHSARPHNRGLNIKWNALR